MSLSHKAFLFRWSDFHAEFSPILTTSLAQNDPAPLIAFGQRNLPLLRDPYEGLPLAHDWLDRMENGDLQEIADYLMTRYYDPTEDGGVGDVWLALQDTLTAPQRSAMLGHPVGPSANPFDPGRMGSYFQTESDVRHSWDVLAPVTDPAVADFVVFLQRAQASNRGLYVTL